MCVVVKYKKKELRGIISYRAEIEKKLKRKKKKSIFKLDLKEIISLDIFFQVF